MFSHLNKCFLLFLVFCTLSKFILAQHGNLLGVGYCIWPTKPYEYEAGTYHKLANQSYYEYELSWISKEKFAPVSFHFSLGYSQFGGVASEYHDSRYPVNYAINPQWAYSKSELLSRKINLVTSVVLISKGKNFKFFFDSGLDFSTILKQQSIKYDYYSWAHIDTTNHQIFIDSLTNVFAGSKTTGRHFSGIGLYLKGGVIVRFLSNFYFSVGLGASLFPDYFQYPYLYGKKFLPVLDFGLYYQFHKRKNKLPAPK